MAALKYANNFRYILANTKAAAATSFLVDYNGVGPTQTFYDVFGNNPSGDFHVPITVTQPDGTVIGTGYAMSWDITATGNEAVVNLYSGGSNSAVNAAWAVGDIVACRLRAEHLMGGNSKYRSVRTVADTATYALKTMGEYCHFDIVTAGSGATFQLPYGTNLDGQQNSEFYPGHYVVTMTDTDSAGPTVTFSPEFGSIRWESGTAPAFDTGTGKVNLFVELWHGGGFVWHGRWIATA